MAIEEHIKLLLDTNGPAATAAFEKSVIDLRTQMRGLAQDFTANKISVDEYMMEAGKLQGELGRVTGALSQLAGKKDASGYGLMGASYAAQDFITVMSMGGGMGRALMSMANNITPVASAFGLGAGLAGGIGLAVTAASAAVPIIESLWKSLNNDGKGAEPVLEAFDAVKERLKGLQSELDKIMRSKPMAEKETAGLVEELFAEEGPQRIAGGLSAALAQSGQGAQLTPEEQRSKASMTKSLAGPLDAPTRAYYERELGKLNDRARERTTKENDLTAQGMMADAATNPAARARIRAMATAFPAGFPEGFAEHLGEMEPEARAAQDADEGPGSEAFAERAHKGIEARAKARKRKDAEEKAMDAFLREEAGQSKKGLAALAKKAEENREVRELEEAFGRTGEEFAAADRNPSEAKQRKAHKAAIASQAGQLMAHGPEIVGQAFGPQAAFEAGRANPAQVQAMKAKTIANLEAGQNPMEAVANAFEEVAEAVERHAMQSQRFVGRVNGIAKKTVGSLRQSVNPSGLGP